MEDLGEQGGRKPILRSRLRPSYRYRASRRLYNRVCPMPGPWAASGRSAHLGRLVHLGLHNEG